MLTLEALEVSPGQALHVPDGLEGGDGRAVAQLKQVQVLKSPDQAEVVISQVVQV